MTQVDEEKQAVAGPDPRREQMNIVVIGHVDHGKSTLVGRMLADTNSLPKGKLEQVREHCRKTARPFEYAFLLDALADEQAQGITIDSARCFFKSPRRDYIIIDAPGHIEFLKNMISGAARAEAGVLVIDAREGIQENSRRHGYLMSMLGIRQVVVAVNKMDLVDYGREVFEAIRAEYDQFLRTIGIEAQRFIPVSAREGDFVAQRTGAMPWYDGLTVLEAVDAFQKEREPIDKPFRMPVQDVYKFTAEGDDRRIVAGRIVTGQIAVGDEVVFLPSGKRSTVKNIEEFNKPPQKAAVAGQSTGITLTTQIYVTPGEVMCKAADVLPITPTRLRVNLFWMGRQPLIRNKRYKLKLANARMPVWLTDILNVMDASNLETDATKKQIERHDVAECVFETLKPVACDLSADIPHTGRFVIIDNYEIAGGGIVLSDAASGRSMVDEHVERRQRAWQRSRITPGIRNGRYGQGNALVLLTGAPGVGKEPIAAALEEHLFNSGRFVYYLGVSNALHGIDADIDQGTERDEYLRRLGEIAHLFTDAGLILIASVSDVDDYELEMIETLNKPGDTLVVGVGQTRLARRQPDLALTPGKQVHDGMRAIRKLLEERAYFGLRLPPARRYRRMRGGATQRRRDAEKRKRMWSQGLLLTGPAHRCR